MADAPAYTPSVPTIRISNIPQPISRDDLEKYLQDLDSPLGTIAVNTAGQTYISLAPEASEGGYQRFQVATVTFSELIDGKVPSVVKLGPPGATFEATVDTHFRGLTPLNNSEKPTIDIIAVTGLAGHAFGSWRSSGRYGMWLRDFLPNDMEENEARIFTYGYDTTLSGSHSHAGIYDLSKQFIEAVKGARSMCRSRPLILIGHSLGGLVIKEAIIQCFGSEDRTLNSIAGILFFSVPHKGLADASLLLIVHGQPNENLVRDLCEGSQYLHGLDRYFGYLMSHRRMGDNIISFYETDETPTPMKVGPGKWVKSGPCVRMVTQESIKHAAGGGEGFPMDANHSSIVKLKDRSDQRYQLVRSKLLGITRTISIAEEETKVPCEERVKICEWLHPGVVDKKHKQISGKRQEGTGAGCPLTRSSCRGGVAQGLVCYGAVGYIITTDSEIAGAGKTFLSSLVIDVLDAHSRACSSTGLAYFYFDYMDQNEQMSIAILRVLIKQLIARPRALNVPIPTLVRSLYDKNCAAGTTPEIKDLQDGLTASLALFKETFFVFDALDECREDLRKQLLSLIHWISGSGTRIFLTSRPYHDISISLNPSTSNSHVEKVELAAKEEDVIIYVQKTIQGHDDAGELIKDDLRLNVISKLVDACKGMFLLVDFYIKDLCEYTTVGGVKNALDGIGPAIGTEKALHDTYGKVMDNIRAQHKSRSRLALKVLTWLLTADCTLPVDELRMAVAMGDEGQVGNPKPFNEAEMPGKSLILTVCRGLVMDDQNSNTIKFVHYSVHEYLEKTCTLGDLASRHLTVAFGCLEHLWFSYIEPHPRRHFLQDDGGLVNYAHKSLHTHIQASHHIAPTEALLRFLRNPDLVRYLGVLEYYKFSTATAWGSTILINCLLEEGTDPDDAEADTPLHIAAGENRVDLVRFWLGKGFGINATDRCGETPLAYAIRLRSIDAARQLLSSGADLTAVLQAPGWRHYEARDPNMLELLFEFGLNVEQEIKIMFQEGHRRYIINAIENDDTDVVDLLLRKGASIYPRGRRGQTVLHWAVSSIWARTDIVRLVLQRGYGGGGEKGEEEGEEEERDEDGFMHRCSYCSTSDHKTPVGRLVDARDCEGKTPLHYAAEYNKPDIIRLLLSHGRDGTESGQRVRPPRLHEHAAAINSRNSDGLTVLDLASRYTKPITGMVPILLGAGADLSVPPGGMLGSSTWLHKAAKLGDEALLKAALNAGVDPHARDDDSRSPLHLAAYCGSVEVVSLLMEKGLTVELRDKEAKTPLHYARGAAIIAMLIDRGASASSTDVSGNTPLHSRLECEHTWEDSWTSEMISEEVILLVQAGAGVNVQNKSGVTPLHLAAAAGPARPVSLLLEYGADIGALDVNQMSAMHYAATSYRGTDAISLLMERGLSNDARDIDQRTPLHHEARNYRSVEYRPLLIRHLAEKGASLDLRDNDGFTPLKYLVDKPIWVGSTMHAARMLIQVGADVNAHGGGAGLIHLAAKSGDTDMLRLLVEAGADIHAHDIKKQTQLHHAVLSHSNAHPTDIYTLYSPRYTRLWIRVAKTLISLGAHVNAADEEQNTPLHMAAQQGAKELLVLLLDAGADIHAHNSKGQTPLHHVVLAHHNAHGIYFTRGCDDTCLWICMAKTLISLGAHVNAVDEEQNTPLHLAAQQGAEELLILLLDAGADINAPNSKGQTPLHHVALSHNNAHRTSLFTPEWDDWIRVAKTLISLGAHVNAADEEQNTPLHLAAQQGAEELLILLLDAGADINAPNSKGQTPLHHVALGHNNAHRTSLFTPEWDDWIRVAKTLISLGAHVNAADEEQNTPLHLAAQQGAEELLILLLDAGADINAPNSKGQTPLHHVALGHNNAHRTSLFTPEWDDWICAVKKLISLGAHVNAVDEEQNTPLHLAAQQGAEELLVLLLDAGADRDARNCSQETPLDIAMKSGLSADITEMLVDRSSEHSPAIQEKTGDQGVEVIEIETDDASCGNGTPSQDPEEGPARKKKIFDSVSTRVELVLFILG